MKKLVSGKYIMKEAGFLLIAAIMLMTAFAVFTTINADYPEGIISYWKFDEDSVTVAYDSVDANHGTLKGGISGSADMGSTTTQLVESNQLVYYYLPVVTNSGMIIKSGTDERIITSSTRTGAQNHYVWTFTWEGEIAGFGEGSSYVICNVGDGIDGAGPHWTTGIVGGALEFDGVDDYVEVGTIIDISEQDAITIEAWFNPDLPGVGSDSNTYAGIDFGEKTVGHISLRTRTGTDPKFQMIIERTVLKGRSAVALSVFNPGEWYHVVGIVTLDKIELYVNGILQESQSLVGAPVTLSDITDDRLRIGGGSGDLGLHYYTGILDEVAVYNRALSADEIEYHYCLGYNFGHGYFDPPTLEYTEAPQPTDSVILEVMLTDSTGFGMEGYEIDFYIGDNYVGTSESTGADGVATLDLDSYEIGVYEVYALVYCLESDPAYLAVYDQDAGFVTGGGWIISPAGAYPADPELTGKAHFGFVSKYQKGKQKPIGNTEFQFHAADMNFHSHDYDWLVVTHHKAMYKGNGTINGDGNYGFILSAIDEALTKSTDVDLFRIKIWDKDNNDEVIYDNQLGDPEDGDPTTAIANGQIVIHKG
jgi:hypothetical protein